MKVHWGNPVWGRETLCFYRADISMEDSKRQTVNLTEMLQVGWSLPEILLLRACHTYTLLAPYAKGKNVKQVGGGWLQLSECHFLFVLQPNLLKAADKMAVNCE